MCFNIGGNFPVNQEEGTLRQVKVIQENCSRISELIQNLIFTLFIIFEVGDWAYICTMQINNKLI